MEEKIILSVDPGKDKCGVALITTGKDIIIHKVVPSGKLLEEIEKILSPYSLYCILVGDGTTSSRCIDMLSSLKSSKGILKVNEYGTTELARKRYFKDNPPRGWKRLIPLGLQVPPEPYDDYAAIILAERFIDEGSNEEMF